MQLIIAEKPDLAKAIAAGIGGGETKKNGYIMKGENIIITWCFGHMLALKNPEEYDEKYKKWSASDLPIFFEHWQTKPKDTSKDQLKIISELMKKADEVVNAGDIDDEGQLLIDELIRYYKFTGSVKRLNTNDLSEAGMCAAYGKLTDNKEHEAQGWSAYARSVADFTVGINYSRFYSVLNNAHLSVGRVQTPTLGLVVARDLQIEGHKEQLYHELFADFPIEGNTVRLKFVPDKNNPNITDGLILEKLYLDQLAERITGQQLQVNVLQKKQIIEPPLPFNLVKLQSYCGNKFGLGVDETLAITQQLREKYHCITYNRSDCQYLMDEDFAAAPNVTAAALKNLGANAPLNLTKKSKAFNSKNATAHTAIVPTAVSVDLSKMTEQERSVYTAICKFYLVQFLPPQERLQTIFSASEYPDGIFRATSTVVTAAGFTAFLGAEPDEEKSEDEILLTAPITPGDYESKIDKCSITSKKTRPPKRYTDVTLNADMTCIAKYVTDPEIKKLLLEKDKDKKGENGSIGTSATRAAIIASLVKKGFLEKNGKQLISTPVGREFYGALPDEIKKPDMTAKWWAIQESIKTGDAKPEDLFQDVLAEIRHIISAEDQPTLTSAQTGKKKREEIGKCPWCGAPVYEGKTNFYCSAFKASGCKFALWKNDKYILHFGKKEVTAAMAKALINKKKVLCKGLKSKNGNTFDAYVCVEWAHPYPKFSMEFPKESD